MSDLLELAEAAEKKALYYTKYALNPPSGYGEPQNARTAAAEWFAIAAALRARAASGEKMG